MLIDDHAIMRAGLANMLNANKQFCVVAQADAAAEAPALFREHRPDVTLLDISMPNQTGIELLRVLRAEFPEARVLMLSSSESEHDILESIRAGALGYVTKAVTPADLSAAIQSVHAGKQVLSAAIKQRLALHSNQPALTPREIEVLGLLRNGITNSDIARILDITHRTAKAHVAAILEKLGASDRAGAVAKGFERGFLKI